jgi:hypothetical protein
LNPYSAGITYSILSYTFLYSEICQNQSSLVLNVEFGIDRRLVCTCSILAKISSTGTLLKVWFIQDSGLFRILVYTGFWFIQDSGLYWILVYSGFWFIQDSGLFRILVYTGFWFIQDSV